MRRDVGHRGLKCGKQQFQWSAL